VEESNADFVGEEGVNNADIERTLGEMKVLKETANGKDSVRGSMYCSFCRFHGVSRQTRVFAICGFGYDREDDN